ncbi:methionine ABC transporter ATP-binding protein [Anaeromicrobium sediminis]|uniref:Methionine ABC transporter ATP-binding protein n=1 Tax=Anaeromicrobium sediminis TaxID=1478221 RepID=A0A267MK47_9FIRM|nr:ATP-binding cassette domain-containing protein [Anaeromicrobium sediminis]PAB59255.1 methionine ABC transporter ATP-binding protein [Anaeromicrobium sediminis]
MIIIKELSKTYVKGNVKVDALKNINLQICNRDIYGIIGLSGAGKSSLVRCINRLEEPTSGSVIINNTDIVSLANKELREMRKKIGMIFQNFNLLSSKTVFENVAFPLRLIKTPEDKINKKVKELLDLVELSDKSNSYPSQLSGGQKQRVGIARALANDPDVLLCDEATSALDPKTTHQILSLLKDINKKLGITIVIITHEMEVIKEICNKVAILEGGRVIEEGNTIDIFSKPGNKSTKHFVEDNQVIPENMLHGNIISLSYTEKSVSEPIISRISREFNIDVNIISGKIEYVQNTPIGKLTIGLDVAKTLLEKIIEYLESNHIKTEVMKSE